MILRTIIFLIINFSALGIGSLFTSTGVPSEWYQNLDKAPWTPPGWMFGAAWTIIMICFAFFMALAWEKVSKLNVLILLFGIQWILNVLWSPLFFKFHLVLAGLIIISLLTLLIGYILFSYKQELKLIVWLVLPYFLWLTTATSLNYYIYVNN